MPSSRVLFCTVENCKGHGLTAVTTISFKSNILTNNLFCNCAKLVRGNTQYRWLSRGDTTNWIFELLFRGCGTTFPRIVCQPASSVGNRKFESALVQLELGLNFMQLVAKPQVHKFDGSCCSHWWSHQLVSIWRCKLATRNSLHWLAATLIRKLVEN